MASAKLSQILRSKSMFTSDQIAAMSDAAAWKWLATAAGPRRKKLRSVCFTGFDGPEKAKLSALAEAAHLRIVADVNASLGFLIWGDTPGEVKIARAKELGKPFMDRSQFLNYIETGEIPTQCPF